MASEVVWENFTNFLPVFRVIESDISKKMTYTLETKVDGDRKKRRFHIGIISDRVPERQKKLLAIVVKEKKIIFRCADRFIEGIVKARIQIGSPIEIHFEQL